jgi:hypothetical protein
MWLKCSGKFNTLHLLSPKCRQVFKDAFKVGGDHDFLNHDTVDSEAKEKGTDENDLRFDMTAGPDDDWNAAVLRVLIKHVKKEHRRSGFPHRPRD